jgi:hypothetical protein
LRMVAPSLVMITSPPGVATWQGRAEVGRGSVLRQSQHARAQFGTCPARAVAQGGLQHCA